MSEKRNIKKGKLLQKTVEVSYLRGDKKIECTEKSKQQPHPDLVKAFADISAHAAFIGEFVGDTHISITKEKMAGTKQTFQKISFNDKDLDEEFITTGFTITGDGEGIILTAHRVLSTGSILGFNTPTVRAASEGGAGYSYWQDLEDKVKVCQSELQLFLDGKVKPEEVVNDPTIKMEFGNGEPVPDDKTPGAFFQSKQQADRVNEE